MTADPLYAVVGPTASGKSALAIALAELTSGEIVTVDSAQVFRTLDVGTAKPTREERAKIPHHLIDQIEPSEQWSAAEFAKHADQTISEVRARHKTPILCGGTGLWLRALIHGIFDAPPIDPRIRAAVRRELDERGAPAMHAELAKIDPRAAARIQPNDPQRIGRALEVYRQVGTPISELQEEHGFREQRYPLIAVGLAWPKEELAARIEARARAMFQGGIIEEVESCLTRGIAEDAPGLSIIGYRDAVLHVLGRQSREEAVEKTIIATRRYAKRQRNWFRTTAGLEWINARESPEDVLLRLRARSSAL